VYSTVDSGLTITSSGNDIGVIFVDVHHIFDVFRVPEGKINRLINNFDRCFQLLQANQTIIFLCYWVVKSNIVVICWCIMAADDGLLTYLTSATQRVISQTSAESYRKGVVLESFWCRQLAQRPSLPVAGVPSKPRYFESSGGRF